LTNRSAGPFVPTTKESMRISMAGDDCSLHFDLDRLTPKQQEDHYSNQVLTAMLQVALMYIAKPQDEIGLYDTFESPQWRASLDRYHTMFVSMGLEPIPMARVRFHPFDDYYASVARSATDTALDNLYMASGSNAVIHEDEALFLHSQNLNSKAHFATHAPNFGITVPDTLLTKKAELGSGEVAAFFERYPPPLMLKILGLAGARNVTTVADVTAAREYVDEYDEELSVILQQRLDTSQYTEMTVDLFVSNDDVHVTNVRKILFADGLWVGNLMGGAVELSAQHEQALLKVGEYARHHGYASEIGFNLGIDYFVKAAGAEASLPELVVTEINARWTGGLFPAELVRRLGIDDQPVVAFIDMCRVDSFADYLDFVDANLYGTIAQDWSIAPMGFAPFEMIIGDEPILFVWQIVVGDFEAFKRAMNAMPLGDAMPTQKAIVT